MQIRENDVVSLTADAVYDTGKEVPGWVKNIRWRVKSISGGRVVLGKSEDEKYEINSPVDVRYLFMENEEESVSEREAPSPMAETSRKAAEQNTETSPKAVAQNASQNTPDLSGNKGADTVSDRGVELIAKYEGCRLEAYLCPAGVWTIGYGHTAGVAKGQTLPSKEAAKALLKEDLKKYGGHVNECVKKGLITFSLNQNQFDALTSFCYNCGNGSLRKLVTDRSAGEIADKMLLYNKGGGKVLPGLTRRREEERALFLS